MWVWGQEWHLNASPVQHRPPPVLALGAMPLSSESGDLKNHNRPRLIRQQSARQVLRDATEDPERIQEMSQRGELAFRQEVRAGFLLSFFFLQQGGTYHLVFGRSLLRARHLATRRARIAPQTPCQRAVRRGRVEGMPSARTFQPVLGVYIYFFLFVFFSRDPPPPPPPPTCLVVALPMHGHRSGSVGNAWAMVQRHAQRVQRDHTPPPVELLSYAGGREETRCSGGILPPPPRAQGRRGALF